MLVAALFSVTVACGGGGKTELAVTSRIVANSTTPNLRVVAPDGDGRWPVVLALHGFGGTGQDMVELATRLARAGAVVFVPTYHTDISTPEGLTRAGDDIGCAYQLARRTAPQYGGDLTRPVTAVGWSLGADLVVLGALGPSTDPGTGRCPGALPRPDVVVALSGCYYEFEDQPVTWFDDLTGWTNKGAHVQLVDGDSDVTCPASQTEKLAGSLRTMGYDVAVTQLKSANHGAPIFHDEREGQWQVIKADPAGEQAVDIILAAIRSARTRPWADGALVRPVEAPLHRPDPH
jgi:dienelactone hydrolase